MAKLQRNDHYNYLYKPQELEAWKDKTTQIAEQAKKTYVIANNHYKGKALVNCLQLKHMLWEKKKKVKAPTRVAFTNVGIPDLTEFE